MSKAFIAEVIQNSAEITGVSANRAAADLIEAIVKEMKKNGKFTLAELWHLHRAQDQGPQGRESAHRRRDQGEGRQDRALQGLAVAEEDGLSIGFLD